MPEPRGTLEVAVFAPLRCVFDYLPPASVPISAITVGARVSVPLGRGKRTGVVLGSKSDGGAAGYRLKPVLAVIDDVPLLSRELIGLVRWAARYYHHPIGEVCATALPALLRRGSTPPPAVRMRWRLTETGREAAAVPPPRAPRQAQLLARLAEGDADEDALHALGFAWRRPLRELEAKHWVERGPSEPLEDIGPAEPAPGPVLNDDQQRAVRRILSAAGAYRAMLLQGVTGSGKTEVYMRAVEALIQDGGQALVLVPEIALTEQLVARFKQRFGAGVAVLHSGLGDHERARTWLACGRGSVRIVLGTRSAVWVPLRKLALIVIDEEHDPSYKQQEGFRYSARDLAVVRARRAGVPIVLGSATPSLESCYNAGCGKYELLRLSARAGVAKAPTVACIDIRGLPLRGGLSEPLVEAMRRCLERGGQALLFLNRRGYAPVVMCHQCGWIAQCERCDAHMVMHKDRRKLVCHHCGGERCPERAFSCCPAPEMVPIGTGTERLEEALAEVFPGRCVVRVDRDSTRRKGVLEETLRAIEQRRADIVVGTQMLAKGHDFKGVTLVAIVDADSRLYSLDFRAEERLAQLLVQVAGRAGRSSEAGTVLVQTHHPEHPLLSTLRGDGYEVFVQRALAERRAAGLPPFGSIAIVRAEAGAPRAADQFLTRVRGLLEQLDVSDLAVRGPVAAVMEKRAGKYRAQLLLSARRRGVLARALSQLLGELGRLPQASAVRWSLDVDPQETI